MSARLLSFLSDFGLRDGYAAAVKGVVLSHCPGAQIVDISHEIPPGAVALGAFVLAQAAPFFPPATVHLAVVDPGVGSQRRAIACSISCAGGEHLYVAPDNGLLSRVLETALAAPRAFELGRRELWREPASPVFHGRDVFAPVAAFLVGGGALSDVGRELSVESLVRGDWPEPHRDRDRCVGSVVHVDRFGNLITNLTVGPAAAEDGRVEIANRTLPVRRTYADVPEGELLALRGSLGLLEVARRGGSAAAALGAAVGAVVTLRTFASDPPEPG